MVLALGSTPPSYFSQGTILFAYIYISNVYAATRAVCLFQYIDEVNYGYVLLYSKFSYTPSRSTLLMAVKTYTTSSSPFLQLNPYKSLITTGTAIEHFYIGYNNIGGGGVSYTSDVFLINSTTGSCQKNEYLYYVAYYDSLPL